MPNVCFVGTCQAMALHSLYNRYVRTDGEPEATYVTSNLALTDETRRHLAGADVIVNQRFSSAQKLSISPQDASAKFIEFPYMAGLFLWPYATEAHVNRKFIPSAGFAPFDEELGDKFLNRLISQGTPAEECLSRYLETDILKASKLEARAEIIRHQQDSRDAETGINAARFMDAHLKTHELFMTRGHLSRAPLLFLAGEVFGRLGVAAEAMARIQSQMLRVPDHRNYAPIHPQIAAFFGLEYARPGRLYEQFYGCYDFEDCVRRYVAYDWNQEIVEGIRAETQGRHEEAASRLLAAVPGLPAARSPAPLLSLARSLRATGRLKEAEFYLKTALAESPDEPAVAIELASYYKSQHRHAEALRGLQDAQLRFPGNPEVLTALSHQYIAVNDFSCATEAAEGAVAASAQRARYLPHLGGLYLRQSRPAEALEVLEQAVALNPRHVDSWRFLSQAQAAQSLLPEAQKSIEQALSLDPSKLSNLFWLAEIFKRMSNQTGVVETYKKITLIAPSEPHGHEELSHALVKIGDIQGAMQSATTALELRPGNTNMVRHLAALSGAVDDPRRALSGYYQLLAHSTPAARAHILISDALKGIGELEGARYALHNALSIEPNHVEATAKLALLETKERRSQMQHPASAS